MTRRVRNTKIDSRTARAKLRAGSPVWTDLGGQLHLGYRRGQGKGSWVARRYAAGKYQTETVGEADDLAEANGASVLTFDEAQTRARQWAAGQDAAARGPVITVAGAVREYLGARDATSGKLKHVDRALAQTALASLTADDLIEWRARLRETLSEASVRRIANDLRAALNGADKRHHGKLPASLRDVIRIGLGVPAGAKIENARPPQILFDADIRRLLAAAKDVDADLGWDGDLERLIVAMAATGSRFSQLTRCTVSDLDVGRRLIMIPVSHKGRGEKKATHTPVPLGPDVVALLEPATRRRNGTDPLFLRPRWRRAPGAFGVMEKYSRGPWGEATTLARPWDAIIARASLASDLVPYCLRHTSITRGLKAGLPTQLVARLHDTSATMVEAAYTRFIVSALEDLARGAISPLVTPAPTPLRAVEQG